VTALTALALYHLGVVGSSPRPAIATTASVVAQCVILRRILHGLELGRLLAAAVRITLAAAPSPPSAVGVWDLLDGALGLRGPPGGQVVSLGVALFLGLLTYLGAAKLMRIAELDQNRPAPAPRLARC